MESLMLSPMPLNWKLTIVWDLPEMGWSSRNCLVDPCLPLKESNFVITSLFFFLPSIASVLHPSAYKSLSCCTTPQSSFPSARWDAAQFMNC